MLGFAKTSKRTESDITFFQAQKKWCLGRADQQKIQQRIFQQLKNLLLNFLLASPAQTQPATTHTPTAVTVTP